MGHTRDAGSIRTALPSRPMSSLPHETGASQPVGNPPRQREPLPRKPDDNSVSPEPRDSIMSDVVSTSSRASSPDPTDGEASTKSSRAGTSSQAPGGQICRFVVAPTQLTFRYPATDSSAATAAPRKPLCGDDLLRGQRYVTPVACIRKREMRLDLPASRSLQTWLSPDPHGSLLP